MKKLKVKHAKNNEFEELKKADIEVDGAKILFHRDKGWALPGNEFTKSYRVAFHVCQKLAKLREKILKNKTQGVKL